MFLIKAGTVIQVEVPKSENHFNWIGWRPYTTKEDRLYDKEEVWDAVAVHNDREDIPAWAHRNITEFRKIVIRRGGKYALVNSADVEYVD
jgi:hypothetical protein